MISPSWLINPTTSHVFRLSVISCIITLIAAIAGIAVYDSSGSTSVLGFAIENFIDLLTSIIVIWRFYSPGMNLDETKKREKRASVGIAFVMLILAVTLSVAAFDEIAQGAEEDEEYDSELLALSIPSMFVFSALAYIKFRYADLLHSPALQKDAICSLFGAILSISVILNSFIIESFPDAWFLDPLVAIFVSVACFIIGTSTIINWWMTDPSDEAERDVNSQETALI